VSPEVRGRLRRLLKVTLAAGAAAAVLLALYGVWRLRRDEPVTYAAIEEHFKYGSTGGERG
jgi:hypothetical protein